MEGAIGKKLTAISIHAPRAGSDGRQGLSHRQGGNFNPRSPCGERQVSKYVTMVEKISIHAPRAGSDVIFPVEGGGHPDFNPRSPCGERLCLISHGRTALLFQSTLPVRGAT